MNEEALASRIKEEWDYWAERLGLQNLWCEIIVTKTVGSTNRMSITWHDVSYYRVYIKVNPKIEEQQITRSVLHEMCHFLLRELKDKTGEWTSDANMDEWGWVEEKVVDQLAAIVWRMDGKGSCVTRAALGL